MNIMKVGCRTRRSGRTSPRQHAGLAVLVATLALVQAVALTGPTTALMDDGSPAAAELDLNFGSNGKVVTDFFGDANQAHAVAIQADGKIVVAGQAHTVTGHDDFAVVRHNVDGTIDTGFGATACA